MVSFWGRPEQRPWQVSFAKWHLSSLWHGEEDEHGAAGRDMMSDIVSQPYLVCTVR